MSSQIAFELVGTGHALPGAKVTSAMLDARLGRPEGDLLRETGVESRYVAESESQIDLAETAARAALREANTDAGAIDLLIFASAVPYQPIPTTAPLLLQRLGVADGAACAFDVNATCLSFLTALETALHQLAPGQSALIVSAELASRALPWAEDPATAALFGDGAAAALIRKGGASRMIAARTRCYPSAYAACEIGAGGTRFDFQNDREAFAAHALFRMDGPALFRVTSRHFGHFVQDLLDQAGWQLEEVDLVIPHQASPFALRHMARQLGVETGRLIDISATYGNQIAASIPFALDLARRDGRVHEGQKILCLGTSAGVSFGGMAMIL